jgi:hypothetical protein
MAERVSDSPRYQEAEPKTAALELQSSQSCTIQDPTPTSSREIIGGLSDIGS